VATTFLFAATPMTHELPANADYSLPFAGSPHVDVLESFREGQATIDILPQNDVGVRHPSLPSDKSPFLAN
jgi:hypothetical protein